MRDVGKQFLNSSKFCLLGVGVRRPRIHTNLLTGGCCLKTQNWGLNRKQMNNRACARHSPGIPCTFYFKPPS
jgi:hypothetical protein